MKKECEASGNIAIAGLSGGMRNPVLFKGLISGYLLLQGSENIDAKIAILEPFVGSAIFCQAAVAKRRNDLNEGSYWGFGLLRESCITSAGGRS